MQIWEVRRSPFGWKCLEKLHEEMSPELILYRDHFISIFGKTRETMIDFTSLASNITADGDCSHEIKGHLLLGRKVMTNLDST